MTDEFLRTINKEPAINPKVANEIKPIYEQMYHCLGYDTYKTILKVFEKYCLFGKTFTNYTMEYSQFCSLFTQNNLYESTLTKEVMEVIYNKVKKNTENKNVTFAEFMEILNEVGKVLYSWEPDNLQRVKYLIMNNLSRLPCIAQTDKDRKNERYYYYLGTKSVQNTIRQYLRPLFSWFQKYYNDQYITITVDIFIKMCLEKQIIPVFLSGKEIVELVNFVHSFRKMLAPTNIIDFSTFIETVCMLSLKGYEKYLEENNSAIKGQGSSSTIDKEGHKEQSSSGSIQKTTRANKEKKRKSMEERLTLFLNYITKK